MKLHPRAMAFWRKGGDVGRHYADCRAHLHGARKYLELATQVPAGSPASTWLQCAFLRLLCAMESRDLARAARQLAERTAKEEYGP